MDDLLADFLTETNESLAELDIALVKLERAPDDQGTLSLIFRLVHTIKGTCGFLGLPRLERVAHAAENVLGRVRDGQVVVSPDVISNVLFALDRIKAIVHGLGETGTEPQADDADLIAALGAICDSQAVVAPPPPIEHPSANPATSHAAPVAAPPVAPVRTKPEEALPANTPADPHVGGAEPAAGESHVGAQTIRVGVDVLEHLMTLVSELVLTRNQLLQLARTHEARDAEMGNFTVPLQRLSHITSDLQEGVMKTRMQPIGNAWNKLPRLVRDLARDLDKRIELIMHGADTELDRQVLELIKDPLTHMVRNSADHGLEATATRRAAGKPDAGRITLNAFHEGGHIIIEVADDGAGLPVDKIRGKAIARGMATEADLASMDDAQIQRFIFRPGFSTAAEVTAVSGRGVGMDVVKTNIEKIGGTIELKSAVGRGTTFSIKIPLTLAIVSALILEAGGERFAIPQLNVVELVRAGTEADSEASERSEEDGGAMSGALLPKLEHVDGTPVLRLRDRLLPLVNLATLLGLEPVDAPATSASGAYIVVTQVGPTLLGIIVDRVFDTEEIVVKPVAPILRHISMFSGNTILGDGSVIMILDVNGIARATGVTGAGGMDSRTLDRAAQGPEQYAIQSNSRIAMLLFRAGGSEPMAVPLSLVARLEDFPKDKIEFSAGKPVTQYRGRLMPLVSLAGTIDRDRERHPVLVFTDADGAGVRERCMGLVVDKIVDVVEDQMRVELGSERPGFLGTAVVAGRATDIIDIGHWLTQAFGDWFRRPDVTRQGASAGGPRILVVEDSDFFRQMLVPTLAAEGYQVAGAATAADALHLRDSGAMFDAIISDIEMPGMDGHAFVRAVRAGGTWQDLPVIALTSHVGRDHVAAGRDAGFTDYVAKFERDALLVSLRQCLAERGGASPATLAVAA